MSRARSLASTALALAALGGCVSEHDLARVGDAGPMDLGARDSGPVDASGPDLGLSDAGGEITECEAIAGARCVAIDEGGRCPDGAPPIGARCVVMGDESSRVCCLE